jgi:flavin reductase (DIM6/NTAB) family NADH-FMN oxidoreductase RutF
MQDESTLRARKAMALLSAGRFVLAAGFEGRRAGVVPISVACAAEEPLLVAAFVRRGHWIEPIIRDARAFSICRVDDPESPAWAMLLRRFAEAARPRDPDGFDGVETLTLATGAPILARTSLAFDCEVHRHYDLDADHELYVGLVRGVLHEGERTLVRAPTIVVREGPLAPRRRAAKGG